MKKLQKGFTLIELMIVVAIIAILAAVAAPKFGQQLKKAQDAKGIEVVGAWRSALNIDYSDEGVYATSFSGLTDNVDAGTTAKTFDDTSGTAYDETKTEQFVKVGTSDNGKYAEFGIETTTTDTAINFLTGNGNDTKGTSWAAY